mgnify:CR=1 FL=1
MKMKKMLVFLAALLFSSAVRAVAQENQLTAKEKKEGWVLLFNGKNLDCLLYTSDAADD